MAHKATWIILLPLVLACSGEEEPGAPVTPPESEAEAAESTPPEESVPEGEAPPEVDDEPRPAQRPGMTRAEWATRFVPGYLEVSCRDGFFFRECFTDMDRPACEREMTQHIASCVADATVDIPAMITSAEMSQQATLRISRCAGTRYEEALMDAGKHIDSERCNDPSNWAGPE